MDQNTTVKDLSQFKSHDQGMPIYMYLIRILRMRIEIVIILVMLTSKLKDLYQHITPQYAADWEVIGTLLGIPGASEQVRQTRQLPDQSYRNHSYS